MSAPLVDGMATLLCTPFGPDGEINWGELARLIEFQISHGVDALVMGGTAGEGPTLTEEEHEALTAFAVRQAGGRVKVIACTGSSSTRLAIQRSQRACAAGADGLLVVGPYYNRTTPQGLVRHFSAIAEVVDRPVILSDIPPRTGIAMNADIYKELFLSNSIHGVKEVSTQTSLVLDSLEKCGPGFHLWTGNDEQIVPAMAMGAQGVFSVLSNILPDYVKGMVQDMKEGRVAKAAAAQRRCYHLITLLFRETHPIPLKTALGWMGFHMGELRLPLVPMTPEGQAELRKALSQEDLGFSFA